MWAEITWRRCSSVLTARCYLGILRADMRLFLLVLWNWSWRMGDLEWVVEIALVDRIDVTKLLGCDYDHTILRTPEKEGKQVVTVLYCDRRLLLFILWEESPTQKSLLYGSWNLRWEWIVKFTIGWLPVRYCLSNNEQYDWNTIFKWTISEGTTELAWPKEWCSVI